MLSTMLTESCFLGVVTQARVIGVAKLAVAQIMTNVSRVIRQARTHTMSQVPCGEVHASSALKTRIAQRIFAKAMNALHVIPDARHATVQALMTVNRVTHPARIRIM